MASPLLKSAIGGAVVSAASLVMVGCPHDFSAFEDVPRELSTSDASTEGSPAITGDASLGDVGPIETATFAMLSEKPTVIAADGTGIVFLTKEGSVLSCPHEGCALPGTIAANQHDTRALAIGYGFVAWTARGDNAIRRSSRTPGSGPADQATDNDGIGAVALTATKVYWAVDAANNLIVHAGVRRCTPGLDCQGPIFDGFADDIVTELRIDGADAFWLIDDTVLGCPLALCDMDNANRTILANDAVLPTALAVDSDHVYYGSPDDGGSIHAIPRAMLAGGDAGPGTYVVAKNVGAPMRLAVTPSSVWFIDIAGTVGRAPRNGGPVTMVATGLKQPTGIAVGGGWVYVTCEGDGRILRYKQD